MNSNNTDNPFKGLYSYEEKDEDLFYGRNRETNELLKLVQLNPLTVVIGKSGIGKTSLMNAGLFPQLRENLFLPVLIRLDFSPESDSLKKQIVREIQKQLKDRKINEVERISVEKEQCADAETLWEYFHRIEHIDKHKKQWTPVLVLDQFEEIFTIGKNHPDRESLIRELYYLVEDQVPDALRTQLLNDNIGYSYIHEEARIRVVIGVRESYLPELNSLQEHIPSIDRVVYRLLPLNGRQARDVMGQRNKDGEEIKEEIKREILKQFLPETDVSEKISDTNLEVEPSLLSLLCHQIIDKRITTFSAQEKDKIIADFYDDVLQQIPRSNELSTFIEESLLTGGGFRTPYYLYKANPLQEPLHEAINKKILRKFRIGDQECIEIIHDLLVPVIKERRIHREEKRKKQKAKQSNRNRIFGVIAIAGLLSVFLGIYAFIQKGRADRQYKNAVIQRLAAESGLMLPKDNIKAIRIAEIAYEMSKASPPPSVQQALSAAAYSASERPFFSAVMQHDDNITSAVFSLDSTYMVTTSLDGTAKLWNTKGALVETLKEHKKAVFKAVFSPKGTCFITVSRDKTAKLWTLRGKLLADLDKHKGIINNAYFSPDGRFILTTSRDTTAKLWNLKGKLLENLKHEANVNRAFFSPGGTKILTVAWNNTAKLWDIDGRLIAELKHSNHISNASFSPDNKKIVTASWDNIVKVWDLSGNILAKLHHSDDVLDANFSPDSTQIVTASRDKSAKLWNSTSKSPIELKHVNKVKNAFFSPDGSSIFTISTKTAKIWDSFGKFISYMDKRKRSQYEGKAYISRDKRFIITYLGNTAKMWSTKGVFLDDLNKYTNFFQKATLSPDSKFLITWSKKTAKLWNLKKGIVTDLNTPIRMQHNSALSPDGSKLLLWKEKTVSISSLNGKQLKKPKKYGLDIKKTVISGDGNILLLVFVDNTIILDNLLNNSSVNLSKEKYNYENASFSPNNDRVVLWSRQSLKLLNVKGLPLGSWNYQEDPEFSLTCVALSPKDETILIVSNKMTQLKDLTGNRSTNLSREMKDIEDAVFSPDGSKILTTSNDKTVKLWDLRGNLLADLSNNKDEVLQAVFNSDGTRIITLGKNGRIKSWYTPASIMQWLDKAIIPRIHNEDKEKLGIADIKFN